MPVSSHRREEKVESEQERKVGKEEIEEKNQEREEVESRECSFLGRRRDVPVAFCSETVATPYWAREMLEPWGQPEQTLSSRKPRSHGLCMFLWAVSSCLYPYSSATKKQRENSTFFSLVWPNCK